MIAQGKRIPELSLVVLVGASGSGKRRQGVLETQWLHARSSANTNRAGSLQIERPPLNLHGI